MVYSFLIIYFTGIKKKVSGQVFGEEDENFAFANGDVEEFFV